MHHLLVVDPPRSGTAHLGTVPVRHRAGCRCVRRGRDSAESLVASSTCPAPQPFTHSCGQFVLCHASWTFSPVRKISYNTSFRISTVSAAEFAVSAVRRNGAPDAVRQSRARWMSHRACVIRDRAAEVGRSARVLDPRFQALRPSAAPLSPLPRARGRSPSAVAVPPLPRYRGRARSRPWGLHPGPGLPARILDHALTSTASLHGRSAALSGMQASTVAILSERTVVRLARIRESLQRASVWIRLVCGHASGRGPCGVSIRTGIV